MITAWRIVQAHRAGSAFDGEGARLFGGRWNPVGFPVVYLADSRALAALETLVHTEGAQHSVRYMRFAVSFPKQTLAKANLSGLSEALAAPMVSPRTQAVGQAWLEAGRYPILEVRSAIIPEEPNYLLNPRHPKFCHIKIGKPEHFAFDPQLS